MNVRPDPRRLALGITKRNAQVLALIPALLVTLIALLAATPLCNASIRVQSDRLLRNVRCKADKVVPKTPFEEQGGTTRGSSNDLDRDGIVDLMEQELAERYAPIIYHEKDEPNLPTNVEVFLMKTSLWFYDSKCRPNHEEVCDSISPDLPPLRYAPCFASDAFAYSHGTRSKKKDRTFYFMDVEKSERRGSMDSREWTTYFHAYPNKSGGITIQYWRFYAYNTGLIFGHRVGVGSHGGDWEAIHIVLDASHKPVLARFLGHRNISTKPWSSLLAEGSHLLIRSEKGGHTSRPFKKGDQKRLINLIRQETWSVGRTTWPKDHRLRPPGSDHTKGGKLLNLGEKTAPLSGGEFIQYSGLWGSRKSGGLLPHLRSGYWGPAFNETDMRKDNFITAWCEGMAQTLQGRSVLTETGEIRECYPTGISR